MPPPSPLLFFTLKGSVSLHPNLFFFRRFIIFIKNLRINAVKLFSRQTSEQFPSEIKRLLHCTVFIHSLTDIFSSNSFPNSKILLINRRQFILTYNRRQIRHLRLLHMRRTTDLPDPDDLLSYIPRRYRLS